MMVLRDTNIIDPVQTLSIDFPGDQFKIIHGQNTLNIKKEAYISRQDDNNGFSHNRHFRKIATIPEIEFVRHPEFNYDQKALLTWLKGEGRQYATVTKGY